MRPVAHLIILVSLTPKVVALVSSPPWGVGGLVWIPGKYATGGGYGSVSWFNAPDGFHQEHGCGEVASAEFSAVHESWRHFALMPCTSPILGYRVAGGQVKVKPGRRELRFPGVARVPCGQCTFCRKMKALNTAVRIVCESTMHEKNCFLTLTYNVSPHTLVLDHVQKFMKRFRKRLEPLKIRHYGVGEYGGRRQRPHWHIIIFGWYPDLEDRYTVRSGLVGSHTVDQAWADFHPMFGFNSIGEVTPASASYVGQYAQKKITGERQKDSYTVPKHVDTETGEIVEEYVAQPEIGFMSKRNGIGYTWFEKYVNDVFPADTVYFSGGVVKPPKYYFEHLKKVNPSLAEEVANARVKVFDEAEYDRVVVTGIFEEVLKSRNALTNSRHKEL